MASQPVKVQTWVDYTSKYGFGYRLTNGSVGVIFNDYTNIYQRVDKTSSANGSHFTYVPQDKTQSKTFHSSNVPESIKKKFKLL
mmetsp:Transcript_26216/g.19694  ORF Transcript_26216/g.19694 Transcript_26216/m.19694 type:complete len:84 (-) Transcript_26216:547-798(-)